MTGNPRAFPTKGTARSERDLSFPRRKPRSISGALTYRTIRFARFLLPRRSLLRWLLNQTRILHRSSFELAGERFGEAFHNAAMALSPDVLLSHIPKNGSVLDVGCGTGRWCRVASVKAAKVVGIDLDAASIQFAKARSGAPNIEYRLGDVCHLDPTRPFDVALLVHLLEHIDDVDPLLTTLRSVTHRLLIEVPDFEADPLDLVRRDMDLPFQSDDDHVREYTLALLTEQLGRNHWSIREHSKRGGAIFAVAETTTPQVN